MGAWVLAAFEEDGDLVLRMLDADFVLTDLDEQPRLGMEETDGSPDGAFDTDGTDDG